MFAKHWIMRTEIRKINLIQAILKVDKETTLIKLETVIQGLQKERNKRQKPTSIYDFVGIITTSEADEMTKAINETCETINSDDWK